MSHCHKTEHCGHKLEKKLESLKSLFSLAGDIVNGCDDCLKVEGHITLNQGQHEVLINTHKKFDRVFISVKNAGCQVCVGDIDYVGYSETENGFVLYADIKSTTAEVAYILY